MNQKQLDARELHEMARQIRIETLRMTRNAKSSHVGSVFSAAEILAVLYGGVMRVLPNQPDWPERDRFVMSKGHAAAGLYAALAHAGFFEQTRLTEYYVDGGSLAGHVTHKGVPGVEVSTGSLGHGLALATGIAIGVSRLGLSSRVFCLLSDGECDEGSTWEAALLAGNKELAHFTSIIDYNKIQSLGRVEDVMPLEPFAKKWQSFGWETREIDGHNISELLDALDPNTWPAESSRPKCIIAHTIKGKGVSFMEDDLLWHYRSPQDDEYAAALSELQEDE